MVLQAQAVAALQVGLAAVLLQALQQPVPAFLAQVDAVVTAAWWPLGRAAWAGPAAWQSAATAAPVARLAVQGALLAARLPAAAAVARARLVVAGGAQPPPAVVPVVPQVAAQLWSMHPATLAQPALLAAAVLVCCWAWAAQVALPKAPPAT